MASETKRLTDEELARLMGWPTNRHDHVERLHEGTVHALVAEVRASRARIAELERAVAPFAAADNAARAEPPAFRGSVAELVAHLEAGTLPRLAVCSECGQWQRLDGVGAVVNHEHDGAPCLGSEDPPLQLQASDFGSAGAAVARQSITMSPEEIEALRVVRDDIATFGLGVDERHLPATPRKDAALAALDKAIALVGGGAG